MIESIGMSIVTLSVEECKALSDPIRATIVNILYHKTLTVEEIANELRALNYRKSITTIRHHIDILKAARVIEVAYTKEKRGTLEKYYSTKVRFLGFNDVSIEIDGSSELEKKISKIIDIINRKYANKYESKCNYCNTNHTKEYVISVIINKILARIFEKEHVNSNS